VSIETLTKYLEVSAETFSTEAVSVETPIIQVEPRAEAGLCHETTEGSCRPTRRLPVGTSKWLSTIQIDECEKHCKSKLNTITVRVHSSKTNKLKFLTDTGAEISIIKGASLKPGVKYESTKGINVRGISMLF